MSPASAPPPTRRTIAIAALLLTASLAQAGRPEVAPPTGSDELVVRFTQGIGEMAGDSRTVLEVWGDGRVVVTRPAYIAGRPSVAATVPRSEVSALLTNLVAHGVFEFNAESARADIKASRRARAAEARSRPGEVTLMSSTDADPTTLEVHAASYVPAPGAPEQRDVAKVIDWRGLRHDADAHPELPALAALRDAHDDLRAFMARPELR